MQTLESASVRPKYFETVGSLSLTHKMVSCLLLAVAAVAQGQMPPVPNPRRPTPLFSWDTVPIAFHGANRSGIYNGPSSTSAL